VTSSSASAVRAPEVSYVVAAFDHEAYVRAAVESILAQDFADLEVVVVDDGSADATPRIVEEMARSDGRIRFERRPHAGVVAARNAGVAMSRGAFVSIVDSDDLIPPDRTRRLVAALKARPSAALAWGDAWIADADGRPGERFSRFYPPASGAFAERLFETYCFVPAVSVMSRRSALDASGPFWGPGASTDYLKWIELGLLGDAVRVDGEPLGSWRLHGLNESMRSPARVAASYAELADALRELADRHADLAGRVSEPKIRRRCSKCHVMAAFHLSRAGEWAAADASFRRASDLSPGWIPTVGRAATWPVLRWGTRLACRVLARVRLPG
jgi:hypothetical protein